MEHSQTNLTKRYLLPLLLLVAPCFLSVVQAQPRFVPDTDIKKVGEVEFNVAKRFSLGFTNKGDKPLLVKKAKASCGCIDVATPKSPIAPGARGEITLTFDAKLLGSFYKEVEVTTNASADPSYIALQGTVVSEVHDYSGDSTLVHDLHSYYDGVHILTYRCTELIDRSYAAPSPITWPGGE